MRYLLIDDLANEGWKDLIEKAVIKEANSLEVAITYDEAIEKIKFEWDFIFLDMRLTENDHNTQNIFDYSGFKILKEIKKEFKSINFSTPVILVTASNKIWNLNTFRENGIDGYYIKESPDLKFDKKTSRENLENLQSSFSNLILVGRKRKEIWNLCDSILNKLITHKYFNTQDKKYVNIKDRIIDKIKLGYAQLFQQQTILEKDILLAYNESMSFIIFWSILEEISKGFTKINETWNDRYERRPNWKFNNGEYLTQFENNELKLNFKKNDKGEYIKGVFNFPESTYEYKKYSGDLPINLSDQIYSLLAAYSNDNSIYKSYWLAFKQINRYRNETDFIHGSVINIFSKKLIQKEAIIEAYNKNIEVLKFIESILNIKL